MKHLHFIKIAIFLPLLVLATLNTLAQGFFFTYTPYPQSYTIPADVYSVVFSATGGSGGSDYSYSSRGGFGGTVSGTLAVTPGQTIYINVGQGGESGSLGFYVYGGYNGGDVGYNGGGASGGSSDIRLTSSAISSYIPGDRLVVAGGGGGAGGSSSSTPDLNRGGDAGYPNGENGYFSGSPTSVGMYSNATGGTQTTPGYNATGIGGTASFGAGGSAYGWTHSGSGGGGYYGGGSGLGSGGAGGSSYAGPGTSNVIYSTSTSYPSVSICPIFSGTLSGNSPVCIGSVLNLFSTFAGGLWTASNTSVATVDVYSGAVSALVSGTDTISYTVSSSCGVAVSKVVVTVNPAPGAITGPSSVCDGQTITLHNTVPGGQWLSSSSAATSDVSSGVITGVSAGVPTITYYFGTTCYVTRPVTVNALSPISGISADCIGVATTLTDATSGGTWSSTVTSVATIGTTGSLHGVAAGTTTISYSLPTGCVATKSFTVVATPTISGAHTLCTAATTTLTSVVGGGTWSSSSSSVVTVGTGSGFVSGVVAGTTTISYSLAAGCAATFPVTVYAFPAAISGPDNVCQTATITLSDATTGGLWSSSSTSAPVGSASGIVTGISGSVATITYNTGGSCYVTSTVTVNAAPAFITGTASVCTGSTATLSSATTGGAWASSNVSIATVDDVTGAVTGQGAGNAIITYSVPGLLCERIITVTVNTTPGPISGSGSVCNSTTSSFTDLPAGGTWTSSNLLVATIGSSTGLLSSIGTGTTTLTYTTTGACHATIPVTITTTPAAATITGTDSTCVASSGTLSASVPGGLWTSSNTAIALTDASGDVTGVSTGSAQISYTLSNTCGSTTTTQLYHIIPAPAAGTLSGADSVCVGNTITIAGTIAGGTWTTSNPNADISGSGVLSGVSAGAVSVVYTVTSPLCGSVAASKAVTVTAVPNPGTITATTNTICEGDNLALSVPLAGGTWAASNSNVTVDAAGMVTGVTAGTAAISYTMANSCGSASAIYTITVNTYAACHLGLNTVSAAEGFIVYPNPSSGSFTVKMHETQTTGNIIITDILGKVIETRTIDNNAMREAIFNLHTAPGCYIITLNTGKQVYKAKVTIE